MSQTRAPGRPMGRGPGGGGPFAGMMAPVQKPMQFGPSAKRVLGRLRPERGLVALVVLLGVVSVTLSVIGPKLLGEATNIIFDGLISRSSLPGRRRRRSSRASAPTARTTGPTCCRT
ncbi:hypothetical protein GCM10025866_34040 [Naasia aerilata]|uniref:Uncharacterized protein n=1 Tax=Naasia aerilata TaxID=1162966 RepID=A0ABM8GGN1_9MICO|nr:hypothetical protein GCM10025866_34040 [Naasia aerilata]